MNDYFITKDKQITPYLLTKQEITFQGIKKIGFSIYFFFSPKDQAQLLANQFVTHRAGPVDPKTLLEAVETYRDFIFEMKDKNKNYEIPES